jgi:hypothetical protein
MSKVLKEIKVISGNYTNKDGQQKNRYQKIGSVIETKNGPMMKIDVIPIVAGGWDGWAYMNDPIETPYSAPQGGRPMGRGVSAHDDDVPF